MDLLKDRPKTLFLRYFGAAFGSTLISSIYGIVDMAMVGQYPGPLGTAALAVISPVWTIMYSLGLLTGIGASVLYSNVKGRARNTTENQYFTVSVVLTAVLAVLAWAAVLFCSDPLLRLFGAGADTMPLAKEYMTYINLVVPAFLFNQMLSAFLRNDGAPGLATAAVLGGGIFNVFGDYFFVFTLDMGARGAGLATAIGTLITLLVLLTHFIKKKKNTLRLVTVSGMFRKSWEVLKTGFSTFFIDLAMGILTMLFNRQIVRYLGTDALAVYGVIVYISTFVQCCAYSVGQAAQPIMSINFGAGLRKRIGETLRYALFTVAFFSVIWTALTMLVPNMFTRIFMDATEQVLAIAPGIMRAYGLSFLLLPLNVFSTYYFQAILKPGTSFIVSVARGLVISGALILLLPGLLGAFSIWYAMVITEAVVAVYVVCMMVHCSRRLRHA